MFYSFPLSRDFLVAHQNCQKIVFQVQENDFVSKINNLRISFMKPKFGGKIFILALRRDLMIWEKQIVQTQLKQIALIQMINSGQQTFCILFVVVENLTVGGFSLSCQSLISFISCSDTVAGNYTLILSMVDFNFAERSEKYILLCILSLFIIPFCTVHNSLNRMDSPYNLHNKLSYLGFCGLLHCIDHR